MTTKKKIDKAYVGKLSKAKTLIIQSIARSADGLNLTKSDINEIMGDWSKEELEVGYHYFKELVAFVRTDTNDQETLIAGKCIHVRRITLHFSQHLACIVVDGNAVGPRDVLDIKDIPNDGIAELRIVLNRLDTITRATQCHLHRINH